MESGTDSKITAQGLFLTTQSVEHILAFSIVFNSLESVKPFVTFVYKIIIKAYIKAC